MPLPEVTKSIESELIKDPHTSDKSIANMYNTTNKTINRIRERLIYNKVIEDPYKRRGTDGKLYRVRQSNETSKVITPRLTKYKSEQEIELQIIQYLSSQGLKVDAQRICNEGRIDILTDTLLYEIKKKLSRERVFEAIGQALIYKQALLFEGKVAIIGGSYEKGIINLLACITKIDIEVLIWDGIELLPLLEYDSNLSKKRYSSSAEVVKPLGRLPLPDAEYS